VDVGSSQMTTKNNAITMKRACIISNLSNNGEIHTQKVKRGQIQGVSPGD
jgi:adenylosuccinate lyase